ncbi:helix-turn-helix domain-containing protein [Erythrobacter tepidarius]|uniref:helix-turn-helix domain-containing protein n=1 Tax=Erythrobacter tepidarius TaxID=60454 RepID=UPI000A3724D7|nr:RodZ domain-containing protein [Erythrobacter tepidarius]
MDSEQDSGTDSVQDVAYAGAGARLRAAREARRIELAQIALETRIPLRHLEAIEAGDFASLPSRTYAIGFSRSFAKAVGLHEGAIIEAVRAELADGQRRHATANSAMEPGDPAKLPSAGLAWFGAFAALVLAVGLIAFFSTRFGAGTGPAPLTAPPAPAPLATATPQAATPASAEPVVLTALADVWLRVYEEGGAPLIEKQLVKDESFTIPASAANPRLNTGRPDLLAITVGGKPVPALSDRPMLLSGVPVSAAALLARAAPAPGASPGPASGAAVTPRAPVRRDLPATPAPATRAAAAPAGVETVPEPAAETPPAAAGANEAPQG